MECGPGLGRPHRSIPGAAAASRRSNMAPGRRDGSFRLRPKPRTRWYRPGRMAAPIAAAAAAIFTEGNAEALSAVLNGRGGRPPRVQPPRSRAPPSPASLLSGRGPSSVSQPFSLFFSILTLPPPFFRRRASGPPSGAPAPKLVPDFGENVGRSERPQDPRAGRGGGREGRRGTGSPDNGFNSPPASFKSWNVHLLVWSRNGR